MQQKTFFRGPLLITLDPLSVEAADVLLSPLKARTSIPVKVAAAEPGPSASASSEAD